MLYKDWDIVLTGNHVWITPLTAQDEVPYSRLMLGELYDRFEKALPRLSIPT